MHSDRFDKFSQRARKVLGLAQEEAQRFNHNYIGTEHLLLGLIREGDGVAAKVLTNMGVDLNKVRGATEFIIGRGDRAPVGEIGLTPRARKVIELAVDEARRMRHHYIGTEHLLLGLVREGEGLAAGVLGSLDVNLADVRDQTIQVLAQSGGTSTAPGWQERGIVEHTASASQNFELGALRRVLPLAQTQAHGEVAVTAISLEDYEHGFRLNLRVLSREPGQPLPPSFALPFVRPAQEATDDRGGRYRVVWAYNRSAVHEQRIELEFASGLNPAARELRLEAAEHPAPDPATSEEAPGGERWELTLPLPR